MAASTHGEVPLDRRVLDQLPPPACPEVSEYGLLAQPQGGPAKTRFGAGWGGREPIYGGSDSDPFTNPDEPVELAAGESRIQALLA